MLRNTILIAAIIAHFILVGADIFGQVVIAPVVLSSPPESLAMFQGPYPYDSTIFWQPANMIALGLLIASVAANWRTSRRFLLLCWLAGSVLVTIWSLGFVFPEYISIISTDYANSVDPDLVERGSDWRVLAFVRNLVFMGIGLLPLIALTKSTRQGGPSEAEKGDEADA